MNSIYCKGKAKALRPIIRKWQELNKKYCNDTKGKDALFWYNERASLSTLAGAIWLLGGTALEEFSSEKKVGVYGRKGRTDLWFHWKRNKYLVEAKQRFKSLALVSVQYIKSRLKLACNDAGKSLPREKGCKRIGVLFYTPVLVSAKKPKLKELWRKFHKDLEDIRRSDRAIFYGCFSPSRDFRDKERDGTVYYYPGVALIGKFI